MDTTNEDFSEFSNTVFCGCPTTFDEFLNIVYIHHNGCPYKYGPVSADHWALLHSQQQSNYAFRDLDEEKLGDYVPSIIQKNIAFNKELLNYRKNQLLDFGFQVGGGKNLLQFKETKDRIVKKAFNGGVHFRIRRFHLIERAPGTKASETTKLRDVLGSLAVVLEQIIDEAKVESKPGDKMQLIVSTEKTPAYWGDTGMESPIATPFFLLHDLHESMVIPFLFRYFKKYDHITLGDQLNIETVLIRSAKNVSRAEENEMFSGEVLNSYNTLKHMKGIVQIKTNDDMCFARAVVVCYFHNLMNSYDEESDAFETAKNEYELVRHGLDRTIQGDYAISLCQQANIKPFQAVDRDDIEKVANYLNVQIKLVNFESRRVISKIGQSTSEFIYLLQRKIYPNSDDSQNPNMWKSINFHFDAITSMKILRGTRNYCEFCDVGFDVVQSHKCFDKFDSWCKGCYNRNCSPSSDDNQRCAECNQKVSNDECLRKHLNLNVCHLYWCSKCGLTIMKERFSDGRLESYREIKERHKCSIRCSLCKREKDNVHKCYMLRQPFKQPVRKLLFFDFETDQSSGVHLPVYCFIQWVVLAQNDLTGEDEIVESGEKDFGINYSVFKDVGKFIFQQKFSEFTCIAHNLKGFDGCFLLRYLIEEGIHVELIANGLKLTSIYVPQFEIRMIDSLNFLQMRLGDMPKTLGIEHIVRAKGYFPHFFTSPTNLTYRGQIPPPEFYGCYDLKDKQYEAFLTWYNKTVETNTEFDFPKELKLYCRQDVEILKEGCLKFRNLMISITKQIPSQPNCLDDEIKVTEDRKNQPINPEIDDPFEGTIDEKQSDCFDSEGSCDPFAYLTAPGVCSAIYKAKFLKQNSIAQILPSGYEHFRHSLVGCEYLEFLRRTKYKNVQFALNTQDGKEIQIGKYRVDGFDPSLNIIIEFNGCFWHGCPFGCIKNMHDIHPIRKQSFASLLEKTSKRQTKLEMEGYVVESMWECQWENLKKTDPQVKQIVDSIFIKRRLNAREAFKGGRTETGLLIYDINNSRFGLGLYYLDICSLYPSVNCFEEYPVGHPEIITSDFNLDISEYFGLIQCQVLPPQNLKNGILPEHVNGKLLFPLCRTCALTQQTNICQHSETERSLFGVWVSEELKQAVENGYKIINIFCVHNFKRKSKELFSNYIKTFFEMKLTASERPDDETDDEFEQFIKEINQQMNLNITKDDFISNAGLRLLTKLCLNCLWGRLGMRDAFPSIKLVQTYKELDVLMNDNTKNISAVRFLTSSCCAVLLKNNSVDTVNISNNTNIYLAVFTTAYARMRLYNLIKQVEDRFVYCDTDSVIFEKSPNESENLKIGKFLGDLTSELKSDEIITDFVSGGPKVYAFKTNKNRCVVKIKGFQLCKANSATFSFENLKKVVENYVTNNINEETGRVNIRKDFIDSKKLRSSIFETHHRDSDRSNAVAVDNAISLFNINRIRRTNTWQLLKKAEQKIYTYNFDKRIVFSNFRAVPFGYIPDEVS